MRERKQLKTPPSEVIEADPDEAIRLLGTLEELFDFYCVQPVKFEEKKRPLNKKLKDAGKPLLKEPKAMQLEELSGDLSEAVSSSLSPPELVVENWGDD